MCCEDHILGTSPCMGLILLILNCALPGVGTIISAFMFEGHCIECTALLCGIIQLVFFEVLFGWVWSIIWGCQIYSKANNKALFGK